MCRSAPPLGHAAHTGGTLTTVRAQIHHALKPSHHHELMKSLRLASSPLSSDSLPPVDPPSGLSVSLVYRAYAERVLLGDDPLLVEEEQRLGSDARARFDHRLFVAEPYLDKVGGRLLHGPPYMLDTS